MHSGPGEYHGFLWFFFINEQLLRFLNLRYPRDYNTVPRTVFLAVPPDLAVPVERVSSRRWPSCRIKPVDRAGRTRLLALCWIGFILVFFTFSTTQEYYSMPAIRRWRCCWARRWHGRHVDQAGHARADGGRRLRCRGARSRFWCWTGTCHAGRHLQRADVSIRLLTPCRWDTWKT